MKYFFTLVALILFCAVNAQSKDSLNLGLNCGEIDTVSKGIDFDTYAKVAFCSLTPYKREYKNKRGKVVHEYYYEHTALLNGKIDVSRFVEIHYLNDSILTELDSILKPRKINFIVRIACYEPRNAILFFDNTGEVIDYLEVCFECKGHETTFENGQYDLCTNQYAELKLLMQKVGIKRGVTE